MDMNEPITTRAHQCGRQHITDTTMFQGVYEMDGLLSLCRMEMERASAVEPARSCQLTALYTLKYLTDKLTTSDTCFQMFRTEYTS